MNVVLGINKKKYFKAAEFCDGNQSAWKKFFAFSETANFIICPKWDLVVRGITKLRKGCETGSVQKIQWTLTSESDEIKTNKIYLIRSI